MTAEAHGLHRTPEEIRASLKDDRSPKSIRAALPPEDRALFDREYWHALDKARLDYDLAPIHEFQQSWWWTAYQMADPDDYQRMLQTAEEVTRRVGRGEPSGGIAWDEAAKARFRSRIERGE